MLKKTEKSGELCQKNSSPKLKLMGENELSAKTTSFLTGTVAEIRVLQNWKSFETKSVMVSPKCRLQTGFKMQTTCRYKMEKLGAKCRLQTGYKMQTTCRYKMEKLGAKCRLQSRFRMQTYILKLPLLSEKNLYNNLGEFLPKICFILHWPHGF